MSDYITGGKKHRTSVSKMLRAIADAVEAEEFPAWEIYFEPRARVDLLRGGLGVVAIPRRDDVLRITVTGNVQPILSRFRGRKQKEKKS